MSKYLKHGVSLIALMIGVTAANAQQTKQELKGQDAQAQTQEQEEGSGKQERNAKRRERGGEERAQGDAKGERKERMSQSGERNMQKMDERSMGKKQGADDRSEGRDRNHRAEQRQNDRRDGDRAERRDGGKKKHVRANITKENKRFIRERVVTHAPKRYRRNEINFNLSVGTAIPRSYVIYDVPPTFIEIVPEYRDYDYIVVGDVLLIIDPDTREIVDVIEV